jgi:hypothetical protein
MFDSRIPLSATTYAVIADNWRNLTHLTLEEDITGDEYVSIGENCQSLVQLSMWGGRRPPQLRRFFQVCSPNLEAIGMGIPLEPSDYVAIASRCHLLRELDGPTDQMGDAALVALGFGCPLLCSLELENNREVTNAGLVAFVQSGALTTLSLDFCDHLTDEGFRVVAQRSPLLEKVEIRNCMVTDVTIIALGRHCRNLRTLAIDGLSVTGEGLQAIAAGCPLLEELSTTDCEEVGPAIEAIARGCSRLRVLVVAEEDVPAEAVRALAACCPLLEDVMLCGVEIGDAEITALVRGCPLLTKVSTSNTSVTIRGLRAIRQHCKMLEEIELNASIFPGGEIDYDFFPSNVHVWVT